MKKSNGNSKLKKKKCNSEGSDANRISSLPESIISHILSFLPTKDAVATSLLSKSWRLHWTTVTSFDFDDRKGLDHEIRGGDVLKMNFVEFVNMALLKHRAEFISKFRLKWQNHHDFRCAYINMWVDTAIARNVKVLDLNLISFFPYNFQLPAALYTCGTLEVLKLLGPFLVKLPRLVCLPKLAVLQLSWVRYISNDCFHKLIYGCPVLQSLKIKRNHSSNDNFSKDNFEVCTISSPVLKRFEIYSHASLYKNDNVKLVIDTPALEYLLLHLSAWGEISIQGRASVNELDLHILSRHCREDSDCPNMIVKLFQALDHVTHLKLSAQTVSALSVATHQFSRNFERLTKLVISLERESIMRWSWSFLMDLIDSCTQLQVLDITRSNIFGSTRKIQSADWRDPIRVPRCLLSSLRRFSFEEFEGSEDEIAVLKYIIEHALVMERVHLSFSLNEPAPYWIKAHPSYAPPDDRTRLLSLKRKFHVFNKVSMMSRVSPTCKISWDGLSES